MNALDAIILAGGRARRLGGASKPDLVVGGRRLLATAIDAARSAGCRTIAVVGPPTLDAPGCLVVRENPPFGGPVAALAAGLSALPAASTASADDDVLVLACDLPGSPVAVALLVAARETSPDADGVCLVDDTGRRQWLAAVYARRALARAVDALGGDVDGAAVRRLAASLDLTVVPDDGSTHDIDTWSDFARATRQEDTMTEHQQTERRHTPEDLDRWVVEAARLAGIDPADVPIGIILDLTRRVAHGVARPAGPVTAYLMGLAVGSGRAPGDVATLAARLGDLADAHGTPGDAPTP